MPADVVAIDGVITGLAEPGSAEPGPRVEVVEARGLLVAPGFVDLQINGGWGHDFTADPSSITAVAAELPATGVTAFLPTIVTSPPARRAAALATPLATPGAVALGWHFEGPMLAPAQAGAHDPVWIGPVDPVELASWSPAVRLVTVAPDAPGALDAITALRSAGVVVSIGHTGCSPGQFAAARVAGATATTHLFNAMAPFAHRAPGPVGATLADPAVVAGLICDGIHVDPVAIAMAWRALGPSRTLLVTDATAALGTSGGSATLGDVELARGPSGVRTAGGVLAGSDLAMDSAVRNLVEFTGCSPAEALGCATAVPAALLGLTDRGRLAPGQRADLVLLDESLDVQRTIVGGVTAWRS